MTLWWKEFAEYACSDLREMAYLEKQGLNYVHAKKVDHLMVFKYKKTSSLFKALGEYYESINR